MNEAALSAARAGRSSICNAISMAHGQGPDGSTRSSMSEHERVTCAYHEAGHAVVGAAVRCGSAAQGHDHSSRSRLGRDDAGPKPIAIPTPRPSSKRRLPFSWVDAVEELCLRQMTSGASNDIERTDLARRDGASWHVIARPGPFPAAVERVGNRQPRGRIQREAARRVTPRSAHS